MRHRRTNATSLIVIVASFVRCPGPARTDWAYLRCGIRLLSVSDGAIRRNRCGRGAPRPTARASSSTRPPKYRASRALDHRHGPGFQVSHKGLQAVRAIFRRAILDRDVLALDVAGVLQAMVEL